MNKPIELYSNTTLEAPAVLERQVYWPGGRGMLVANFNPTGSSAKIVVSDVNFPEAFVAGGESISMVAPALSIGGVSEITASGNYLVDLPKCRIQFDIVLTSSDEMNISYTAILPMGE